MPQAALTPQAESPELTGALNHSGSGGLQGADTRLPEGDPGGWGIQDRAGRGKGGGWALVRLSRQQGTHIPPGWGHGPCGHHVGFPVSHRLAHPPQDPLCLCTAPRGGNYDPALQVEKLRPVEAFCSRSCSWGHGPFPPNPGGPNHCPKGPLGPGSALRPCPSVSQELI